MPFRLFSMFGSLDADAFVFHPSVDFLLNFHMGVGYLHAYTLPFYEHLYRPHSRHAAQVALSALFNLGQTDYSKVLNRVYKPSHRPPQAWLTPLRL